MDIGIIIAWVITGIAIIAFILEIIRHRIYKCGFCGKKFADIKDSWYYEDNTTGQFRHLCFSCRKK